MAISPKYGPLDIPGIGKDEPVFILRGQDALAARQMEYYWSAALVHRCGDDHLKGIDVMRSLFVAWALEHPTKVPDSDPIPDHREPEPEAAPPELPAEAKVEASAPVPGSTPG